MNIVFFSAYVLFLWIMTFLLFSSTRNYHNRIYLDMADLGLTYINQNFIDYIFHESEIKFPPLYNSMEKYII